MNDFEMVIKQWHGLSSANVGLNEFIAECGNQGLKILDTTSHVSADNEGFTYTVIFKLKWNGEKPRKKVWQDERW